LYSPDANLAQAFTSLLQQMSGFELLSPCMQLSGLQAAMESTEPDVVLVDLNSELTFAILTKLTGQNDAKIVLWVNSVSAEVAIQAVEMGIRGILRKTLPANLHIKCLETIASGGSWFEKAIFDRVTPVTPAQLTDDETRLVFLLTQGLKNKEIAREMQVTETQVRTDLSLLFRKIGVKDRFELALYGVKNLGGLRPPAEDAVAASEMEIEAIA
jgi:DNA-binding NarL/FixJ family response regulator